MCKCEIKHEFIGVVPSYQARQNSIIDRIVAKVNACEILGNTLQAIDFQMYQEVVQKLEEAAKKDIEEFGMRAVG